MINRCTDPKKRGTFILWKSYEEFRDWHTKNYVPGWDLDKDLLVPGNTEYGPDTCRYVPRSLNSMQAYNILDIKSATKHHCGYRARLRWNGVQVTLGRYATEAEAVYWMRRTKIQWVFNALNEYRQLGVCKDVLDAMEKRMREFAAIVGRAR
jgi:hypothetical protein